MSDIYSDSIYLQIKSPCKETFPFPTPRSNRNKNIAYNCFTLTKSHEEIWRIVTV